MNSSSRLQTKNLSFFLSLHKNITSHSARIGKVQRHDASEYEQDFYDHFRWIDEVEVDSLK